MPSAAFGDDGAAGKLELASVQRVGRAAAPQADRLQQALAACRARGFADGSDDQRRCAERLLGGAAAPAPTKTAPPTPVTTPASPPAQPGGGGQQADRQRAALAVCLARGFAEGSDDLRRCAERLLGGGATPPTTTTAPPAATTPAPRPAQPGGGAQPADRLQQALAACRARGFADGSDDQRRCAERLLGDSTPAAPTTTAPRQPTTTAPPAPRGPLATDRGIVQSAVSGALVLRALDGSSLVVAIDARTQIFVGDRPVAVADIQPGSVATVRHRQAGPAIEIRVALPPKPKLRTDRGITESVSPGGVLISLRDGTTKAIAIGRSTRVQTPNGREAPLSELRVGLLVDILYDPAGATPAPSVKIIRRVP